MDFPRRFVKFWRGFTRQHDSISESHATSSARDPYEDGPISNTERLSRFIFDQSAFTASTVQIKFRQFLPPKSGEHAEEVSVMRTETLAEDKVWTLGQDTAAVTSGRPLRARGDFEAPAAKASRAGSWQLDVQPSVPPPRHALVVGWPPVSEREARKSLAQQLRQGVRLVVR